MITDKIATVGGRVEVMVEHHAASRGRIAAFPSSLDRRVALLPGRLVNNVTFHIRSIAFTSTLRYRACSLNGTIFSTTVNLIAHIEEAACSFSTVAMWDSSSPREIRWWLVAAEEFSIEDIRLPCLPSAISAREVPKSVDCPFRMRLRMSLFPPVMYCFWRG